MSNDTRQPSVDEAVAMIKRALTDEYKVSCFKKWIVELGQPFVDEVQRRLEGEKK